MAAEAAAFLPFQLKPLFVNASTTGLLGHYGEVSPLGKILPVVKAV